MFLDGSGHSTYRGPGKVKRKRRTSLNALGQPEAQEKSSSYDVLFYFILSYFTVININVPNELFFGRET